jgi:DedD protein
MTADDRRVKERLVGASILLMLLVLIVPELLSGPAPRATTGSRLPASAPEPVRNITVDLATSKAPAADPSVDAAAASIAQPPETQSAAVDAPAGALGAGASPQEAPPPDESPTGVPSAEAPRATVRPAANEPRAASSTRLETRARGPTSPPPASKPATAGGPWAVQLGSFASRANADKLMHQLKTQGFQVYVVSGGSGRSVRYRVRVGPLADRGTATQAAARLKTLGHASSFVPPAR